jgi:hypothetical protein
MTRFLVLLAAAAIISITDVRASDQPIVDLRGPAPTPGRVLRQVTTLTMTGGELTVKSQGKVLAAVKMDQKSSGEPGAYMRYERVKAVVQGIGTFIIVVGACVAGASKMLWKAVNKIAPAVHVAPHLVRNYNSASPSPGTTVVKKPEPAVRASPGKLGFGLRPPTPPEP